MSLDRIEGKIDLINTKLDNHLERLSKAEVSIEHMQGYIKTSTIVFLGIVSTLAITYWQQIVAILLNIK